MSQEIWIATTNKGKLVEFKTLLESKGFKVHSAAELSVYSAPPETGKTFVENARIKARAMKSLKSGVWAFGEDSGLEVIGLNNMPGIYSARYAGANARDSENVAKLLKMMSLRSADKRDARFVCALVAYSPEGEEFIFEEKLEGEISRKVIGNQGFGYDPIFIPNGEKTTMAELGAGFKNRHSHRALAIKGFLKHLGIGAADPTLTN